MNDVKQIVNDIKNKNFKPIYLLMGEEPYYIDKISDFIQNNILDESQRGFDQTILYGKDVEVEDVVSLAKRFPMLGEYQVIIIKEAQDLARTIDKFEQYVENPQLSTILVLNYKYKKLDKRKKITKLISKHGLVFESKKMYDNQIPDWISRVLKGKNYTIAPKAAQMLVEFLGTDLSKISNEVNKLTSIIKEGTTITPELIEDNIGISKDYNVFELRKAIGAKEVVKANKIINYFNQNPKSNPLVLTISSLTSFFTQLLLFHGLQDKSKMTVAKELGVNPFFVNDYINASKSYSMKKVAKIINYLREADVKSKGVGANQSNSDILKELLFKIMH